MNTDIRNNGAGSVTGSPSVPGASGGDKHLEVVLAGFGGQGVLLIGRILAQAGMEAGLEVTWMPAYGPEMRGGTCNCSVVLSSRPIGSPMAKQPHCLIALNLPSLDKFEGDVRPGGVIVVNTSLINRLPGRDDVLVVPVPASDLALEAGNLRAANVVALGALVGAEDLIEPELIRQMLGQTFAGRQNLVDLNMGAFNRGLEVGSRIRAEADNRAREVSDE